MIRADRQTEAEPPSHFSIEVKTNGQWIPLGYEFADVPSDAGAINIQPLGSGYETAVRFVADGEVLASTEDFTVQPPSFQKRDGEEGQSAAVAPAATSVGESLLLAPSAPSAASGDGDAAPAADTEEGSLILAPSATDSSSDASTPSSSESATTARVANGPGKAGPAPTPGATIVANGTTLTLSEDTATVEVQDAGSTLLHQSPEAAPTGASADSKTGALSSKGESTESKDSHKASTGSPSSSGPLRLINDGDELSSNAGSAGIITPGTLTAVAASAGPSLQLASGDEEGSLILAPGTATAGGMGAGGAGAGAGSAATEDAKGGLAVASQSAGSGASASHKAAAADAAGAKQGSGGVSLRPSVIVSILAGIAALTL